MTNTDKDSPADQPPRMPLWVKVFGIVGLVILLLILILHLSGRGLGGHIH